MDLSWPGMIPILRVMRTSPQAASALGTSGKLEEAFPADIWITQECIKLPGEAPVI